MGSTYLGCASSDGVIRWWSAGSDAAAADFPWESLAEDGFKTGLARLLRASHDQVGASERGRPHGAEVPAAEGSPQDPESIAGRDAVRPGDDAAPADRQPSVPPMVPGAEVKTVVRAPLVPGPVLGIAWAAPFAGTKIMAVGRNYRPHAAELGNEVPAEPLWFTKPPSSLVAATGQVRLPTGFGQIDYEGEVAVLIGQRCSRVPAVTAWGHVAGCTLALDITARQLQKRDGQWTRAKGFDTFCPLGPVWVSLPSPARFRELRLQTLLNGRVVQDDRLGSLVFDVPVLIEHLSACMTLEPGDVILTGTPAGVGPLAPGDLLAVSLSGAVALELAVSVT